MSKGGILHNEIKRQGRKFLSEKGFKEDEIFEEYKVSIGRRNLIVDVVGISGNRSIAIECGGISDHDKIPILRAEFDEVIHLPYLDKTLVSEIEGYKREIRSKNRTIENLLKTIGEMTKTYIEEKEEMLKIYVEEKESHRVKVQKESKTESHIPGDNSVLDRIDEKLQKVISTLREIVGEKEPEAEEEMEKNLK